MTVMEHYKLAVEHYRASSHPDPAKAMHHMTQAAHHLAQVGSMARAAAAPSGQDTGQLEAEPKCVGPLELAHVLP